MDIYEYLKKDHEKVSNLFKQFHSALSDNQYLEIYTMIEHELVLHVESEENTFYKKLEENKESKDIALHGEKEHGKIESLLAEISKTNKTTDNWLLKVKSLQELVEHHVSDEEGEMFSKAKSIFSEEEAIALKEQMHDYKEKMLEKIEE